jgi:hypothetical protein
MVDEQIDPTATLGASFMVVVGRLVRMAYESPDYRVLRTIGRAEIREYEPYLAAETVVEGSIESAGNRGFRTLAGFIFGRNTTTDQDGSTGSATKIAMTTPVTQQPTGDRYRIQFMMPSRYTRESLPEPTDPSVEIRLVDAGTVAAIRYSGRWSATSYEHHLQALRDAIDDGGLEAVGEPVWARYDPPWKPWFLRRNEILIQVHET